MQGLSEQGKGLERAKADLDYYSHRILKFYQEAKLNTSIIELRNSLVCSSLIVGAALRNKKIIRMPLYSEIVFLSFFKF